MSFTYSGDPSTNVIDLVRFKLGDTSPIQPLLTDEEIQYMAANSKDESQLLALAFRQAATTLGARTVKRTLGPQSEDGTKRLDYFIKMADKLEKDRQYAGVPPLPDYAYEKVFDKGMMANEE